MKNTIYIYIYLKRDGRRNHFTIVGLIKKRETGTRPRKQGEKLRVHPCVK